ncbi:MAG TPA: hypothetical protein VKH81_22770 [Candidatus Angelobacter sp.]|nr:hypothetical protein [Candidatus Angelobacter sp.]
MPEISNVKNALQTVVKKDRILGAVFAGGKSLVSSLARVLYAFWLQTTGLLYVFFTSLGIAWLIKHYRADHFANHTHLLVVSVFTLVCAYFTVQSFVRASQTIKKRK